MSARFYLDDCAYSKLLYRLLQEAGHDVEVPQEADLTGAADPVHFEHARQTGRILVTKNPADFLVLHRRSPEHAGIIAIYLDNRPSDMKEQEIVQAIENVLRDAGQPLTGHFVNLNHWRY